MLSNVINNLPTKRRYLIGFSGGRDSVALLHLLVARGFRKLLICHLDHQLRGRSSRADATSVGKLAAKLGLEAEIGSADVRALAKKSKLSIETARVARFAFFVSTARKRKCRTIFLAHHADDLVETALLNLFRGAGPGGIAAMRGAAVHCIGKTSLRIIRPLLETWREEIDSYIKEHALKFREDKTNATPSSTRNKIRHRLLPVIKQEFGRDVRKTIWRAAQIWAEEETLLDSLLPEKIPDVFSVAALRKLPIALQRRMILRWLRQQSTANVNFANVEEIRALLAPEAKIAKVNLARNRHARRRAGKIFIE